MLAISHSHVQSHDAMPASSVLLVSSLNTSRKSHPTITRQNGRMLAMSLPYNRLVGLVVKASASGAEDPGFESRLRRDFSGSSHTSDSKIGTPVATLPGAWH